MKEAQLQQYIWDNRDRWQELLLPLELEEVDDDYSNHFEGGVFEEDGTIITLKPETFFGEPDPGTVFASLIQRRIREYYEHVRDLQRDTLRERPYVSNTGRFLSLFLWSYWAYCYRIEDKTAGLKGIIYRITSLRKSLADYFSWLEY